MALDQFHHGVRVVEVSEGTRTIRTVATAVIGIICTGSDADAAYFPLNKPVLIANLPAAIAKAGSTGNLKRSLQTIYDTVNTIVIAVRVADGADAAELTSNIIGTILPDGSYTGLKALERAAPATGVKPRILCVPDNCTMPVATALAGILRCSPRIFSTTFATSCLPTPCPFRLGSTSVCSMILRCSPVGTKTISAT